MSATVPHPRQGLARRLVENCPPPEPTPPRATSTSLRSLRLPHIPPGVIAWDGPAPHARLSLGAQLPPQGTPVPQSPFHFRGHFTPKCPAELAQTQPQTETGPLEGSEQRCTEMWLKMPEKVSPAALGQRPRGRTGTDVCSAAAGQRQRSWCHTQWGRCPGQGTGRDGVSTRHSGVRGCGSRGGRHGDSQGGRHGDRPGRRAQGQTGPPFGALPGPPGDSQRLAGVPLGT